MNFTSIPKQYRPIPFWSWNEKLDTKETAEQVHTMHEAGLGGFFMHARGGLQTDYMGDEWFANVEAAIQAGEETGMGAWAYDENGWPSGFGNGYVNGKGIEYQQKYLRMSETEPTENVIAKCGDHWFYFDVNPFYVDVLDKKVIKEFIDYAYTPYYERYGNRIEGFFTDEPQISRNGIPWSFVFEGEYMRRYGAAINEHLEELFLPVGDYKNTRVKFWKMVTDLFSESFLKQIYDQCNEWGLKLTGHLVLEEDLYTQITGSGACMPHYEYMHIPGMDWLGRDIFDCLTTMQLSSACEQLGIKQVLSETFALCGHNVSFAELKGLYEWQMVHGINLLCQHLEGYSIRGIRKRDYPPAMYCQQPWWSDYKEFMDAMSRESMILAESRKQADVLLLHPQTTAWSMYDGKPAEVYGNEEIEKLHEKLLSIMRTLEKKHIMYHLGDETLMERHARVENGKLVIGEQQYSCVIDSACEILLPKTQALLDDFLAQGGTLVKAEDLPDNPVCDSDEITYVRREHDDYTVHFFVNTSKDRKTANIHVNGKKLDAYTGELTDFPKDYEFEPWGSLMILEDETETCRLTKQKEDTVRLSETLTLAEPVQNAITLDVCDYYFDGELQEKNGYVLNICERANELERPVQIHQDYHVKINYIPEQLFLVCETPDVFAIRVNGELIDKTVCGFYLDKSFKKIDIAKYIVLGENTISFDCAFKQSKAFYENRRKSLVFESEKNKLAYDMEIEAIYLLGAFSVTTDGTWEQLERNAVRFTGSFALDAPKETVRIKHIEQQGYPFFCGEMKLAGEVEIAGENPVLDLNVKGINAVRVKIGNKEKVMLTDNKLPLKEFGVSGKTKIELTLVNNLRNILGPHHLEIGESYAVGPGAFFKESCVWASSPARWNAGYCFVETSL
ncbi:MAG: hypothetical protein E7402_04770 [Ruminococcaceae bacterium]|nr:hypothetical protein [Oscillospiraceae bacterium]